MTIANVFCWVGQNFVCACAEGNTKPPTSVSPPAVSGCNTKRRQRQEGGKLQASKHVNNTGLRKSALMTKEIHFIPLLKLNLEGKYWKQIQHFVLKTPHLNEKLAFLNFKMSRGFLLNVSAAYPTLCKKSICIKLNQLFDIFCCATWALRVRLKLWQAQRFPH